MYPKIISLVVSYEPSNKYVELVIQELAKVSNVILFTTEEHSYHVYDTVYFSKSIGLDLAYEPRKWIVDHIQDEWDYVLYNEDDIFIPKQSIDTVINLYNNLPSELVPGFIRYEVDNDVKRYIDMHPGHAIHRSGYGSVKQVDTVRSIWEPWNIHSGNWLLSKSYVLNLIQNNRFDTYFKQFNPQYGNCSQLESCATSVYQNYTKVYPIDFESVECWHMPNKYITMLNVKNGNPTTNELKQLIYAS